MQRYNIALVPADKNLSQRIVDLSQSFFGHIHDHYILGAEGIPHVTLCQFYAASDEDARAAFNVYVAKFPDAPEIIIESFQIRAGALINAGKFIAEYYVEKSHALAALQKECAALLESLGIKNETPCERYAPHFTLARLGAPCESVPQLSDIPLGPHAMVPRLGLTSETGVFVRDITNV